MWLLAVLDTEPFVGVNFWTIIFAWCNLLILYLFLKKLLFVPIKNMIDSRQSEIDGMYSDAEESRKSAAELLSQYEGKISEAEEESDRILKGAQRRAELKEEAIINQAKAEADRIIERAEELVALEKRQAINEVKDEVSAMALDIAAAVIGRDVSEDEHKDMIDEFIENMGRRSD